MSLPNGHPAVPNDIDEKMCPALRKGHEWRRLPTDSRSPCPALNTLANHGYLPRNGRNLSVFDLIVGLMKGYNLSLPLAAFLSIGGFFLLRKLHNLSLHEIGEHGRVEHDASLVHNDTRPGEKYAPIEIQPRLVDLLIQDATTGDEAGEGEEHGDKQTLVDATDVARARIRREKQSDQLDGVHAEIARGEMGIILGVWETKKGGNVGIPANWLREWIEHERFPTNFRFTHVQGLLDVVKRSKAIRTAMTEMRQKGQAAAKAAPPKAYL